MSMADIQLESSSNKPKQPKPTFSVPQEEVSRNPSDYTTTEHFVVRKQERGITGRQIRETIESGSIDYGKKDNYFEFEHNDIRIIVDITEPTQNNVAVTVMRVYE
ncbi:hypothetical protein ACFQL7_20160 [Halocatena marina]|uniref:DUF4258 domain-containing protein n=1 Tax=Halocatena marina TaxID=2934937 RepID=A0ABD5YRM1_9EURY|nr:DUF4258 domain-containing protein [Halocatena marina]